MKGRKPKAESHAAEIRAKLAAWKQTPEYLRPSLRDLARQMGTSHQLLAHYLRRLEKWQAKECEDKARRLRARAEAENRLPHGLGGTASPGLRQRGCAPVARVGLGRCPAKMGTGN